MTYQVGPWVTDDGTGMVAWTTGTAGDLLRELPDLWQATDEAAENLREENDR